MSFITPEFLQSLPSLSRVEADAQIFGLIKVNDVGLILLFNKVESELASIPVAQAEGKNFFTQVAPCTNNRLFYGRFKDGVAQNQLDVEFDYIFTYRMRPTQVKIRLYRHLPSQTNYVFVLRK
jgi:photoactive yellow protein